VRQPLVDWQQTALVADCHDGDVFTPDHTSFTAIIVPYRNREAHLRQFVEHMHSYLRNELNYRIYVVHQVCFYNESTRVERKT